MGGEVFELYREWYRLMKEMGRQDDETREVVTRELFTISQPPSTCVIKLKHVPLAPESHWGIPPPTSMGPGVLSLTREDEVDEVVGFLKVYVTDPKAPAYAFGGKFVNLKMLFYLAAVELMNEDVDVASCFHREEERLKMRLLLDEAKRVVKKWWEKWGK